MNGDHDPKPGVQQVSGGVNSTHLSLLCSSSTRRQRGELTVVELMRCNNTL